MDLVNLDINQMEGLKGLNRIECYKELKEEVETEGTLQQKNVNKLST